MATNAVAVADAFRGHGVRDMGVAPATTRLGLALTLRYRNQEKLDRLVSEQIDPASSSYRRWLSNEQFNAEYAPAARDYNRVIGSLRAAGFHVDTTYANRTVVDVSGSAGAIDAYFKTAVHAVEASGQRGFANVRPAYAPGDIAPYVLAVDGLTTIISVHADHALYARGSGARHELSPDKTSPLFGPVSTVTGAYGYAPLAFAAAYDFPIRHAAGGQSQYDGSGRASGIVIDADVAESDITQYLAYFSIKRHGPASKRVLLRGGPPQGDAGADSIEAALDAEALVGGAPGTALSIYEMPSFTNVSITDTFNRAISDNVVDTLNASFGGCETDVGVKTTGAWKAIAEQGASKGITFHASTGDSGGGLCVNAPASLPYVTAVGGTALTVGSGGSWAYEVGWSNGGGGVSSMFGVPSWQMGTPGVVNRGRNIPDVALDADPYTGMGLFFTGTWNTQYNPIGGTSLSSPLFGVAVTQTDQLHKGRMGLAAAALFGALSKHGYGSAATPYFHDIVQGNDGPFYTEPGYDLVTGIGSLDMWNIDHEL